MHIHTDTDTSFWRSSLAPSLYWVSILPLSFIPSPRSSFFVLYRNLRCQSSWHTPKQQHLGDRGRRVRSLKEAYAHSEGLLHIKRNEEQERGGTKALVLSSLPYCRFLQTTSYTCVPLSYVLDAGSWHRRAIKHHKGDFWLEHRVSWDFCSEVVCLGLFVSLGSWV